MDFDPNKALAYARALARPRLVGSGEDERVAQEVVEQLQSFGYTVEREPFQYTRAFDSALAYEIGLALLLIVLAMVWADIKIVAALLTLLLLISTPFINDFIQRRAVAPDPNPVQPASPFLGWGRLYRTANIVARPRQEKTNAVDKPYLYLMAHFDSKSQRMPIVVRVVLITFFLISVTLFVIASLAAIDLTPLPTVLGVLALLFGIPLLLLDVGNESSGAIDNASGMGMVLHLAEVLQTRPDLLDKLRITFLITSGEEMATMGALFHVQRNLAELHSRGRNLSVLNFDGVGVEGQAYWAGKPRLGAALVEAARSIKVRLRPFRMPGLLFDHVPFAAYGLNAATLMTIGSATWGVHTSKDNAESLSATGFEKAGRMAMRVVEKIAGPT